jgi:hypothetical protein
MNSLRGRKLAWTVGRRGQLQSLKPVSATVWRIEDWKYAPLGFGSWFLACASALDNKVVRVGVRVTGLGQPDAVFEILTKWFSLTRLETRTKESNIYASIWVVNPCAQ